MPVKQILKRCGAAFLVAIGIACVAWPVLLMSGCAHTEERTRTALDAIGAVVDPAYEAAMLGCEARAQDITEKLRAEGFKQAYADDAAAITKRCDKTAGAFETIRKLHEQAISALEGGALEKAQDLYRKLLMAWAALKGGA